MFIVYHRLYNLPLLRQFSQKRFSLSYPPQTIDEIKWFVGLTYTTEAEIDFEEVTPSVWLKPTDEYAIMAVPEDSGWIIVNIQSSGKYNIICNCITVPTTNIIL